jgi:hypothetical protein
MSKAKSIVRMEYFRNRTPTGRPSATAVRHLTMYLAYGRGRPQEQRERSLRGLWHDQSNTIQYHRDVLSWVEDLAKQNRFTYQFILSAKGQSLYEEQYNDALYSGGDLFSEWRLISHSDSRHAHAHVLAFDDREILINDPQFQSWCQRVREALAAFRDQHLELSQEQQQQIEQLIEFSEPQRQQSQRQQWGFEL